MEFDQYTLYERECSPGLVEFLVSYKKSKNPFQNSLNDLDKRVLQEYSVLVQEQQENTPIYQFKITSGLLGYQFRDYCNKRQFEKLLHKPRELMTREQN